MLLLALLDSLAEAHSGAVPIRGVYDWSKLPQAEPWAWVKWDLFPSVVLGCLAFVVGYELLAGPLRRRWSLSPVGPTRGERLLFHGGVALVFCSLQGPLHELSDVYLFSGHMVQHLVITLIFPPMAIRGIPPWMWTPVVRRPWLVAFGRFLTRPLVAILIMTTVLWGWHLSAFYDWALEDHDVHIVEHLSFMAAFVIMWWPAYSRLDAIPPLTPGWRMIYLFLCTIPMKALGAMLTMSDYVLYGWYATQPRVFGLDPLVDQRAGGLIMWLPGGLVFWVSIGVTFFRHFYREFTQQRGGTALVAEGR